MSHIVITNQCNKNCSFCFAKQERDIQSKQYMDIDFFKEILQKDPNAPLMGGEPTLHPEFHTILNLLKKENDPFIISNFLFSENIRKTIIDYAKQNIIAFLINASELDIKNRIDLFKKNYNDIYDILNKTHQLGSDLMPVRITYPIDFNLEQYMSYIDFLHKEIPNISTIRISTACPYNNEQRNVDFLGNTKIGDNIVQLASFVLSLGLDLGIDNILYRCMYDTKDKYLFVKKYNKQDKICGYTFIPMDYMPNKKVLYCYSNSKINVNFEDYKTSQEIEKALDNKAQIIKDKILQPKICSICNYNKECGGPCLGYFKY